MFNTCVKGIGMQHVVTESYSPVAPLLTWINFNPNMDI